MQSFQILNLGKQNKDKRNFKTKERFHGNLREMFINKHNIKFYRLKRNESEQKF